ncbi:MULTISPECIES: GNAT family N-acetyltransferase [Mumia]|uniref:GNAT family N-acetyltransferase n=1 Tax=Mumia TaxID=1546255 RepID=UPI001AB05863|nr:MULTISPECIES: GNAT family N-acetyltransferase [unclassified Mumia]
MTTPTTPALDIRVVPYDHADATFLIDEVQALYAERYGIHDVSPSDPAEFHAPGGLFAVAYDGSGQPVATGGWRMLGDWRAEVRRMYVREAVRGQGYARRVLAWLEETARAAGATTMVLETGQPQPEAIALYRSAGYSEVAPFGYYADDPQSLFLGKALGGS